MLRFDNPKSMSPASTTLVLRSGLSAFSHAFVVVHACPALRHAVKATVGPPFPDTTMTVWPLTSGVFELAVLGLTNGRSQSSVPVAELHADDFPA